MRVLRPTLLVALVSLSLLSGSMMSRQVAAQASGPRVTIDGPLPVPVDDSPETVLALDQTLEVSGGGPFRLGPIDVSGFRQVRIAARLESGAAADVSVVPVLVMGTSLNDVVGLAPSISCAGSVVVDLPGRSMMIALFAQNTTTCQIQVYGRK